MGRTETSAYHISAIATLVTALLALSACGSLSRSDYGPSRSMNMKHVPDLVPRNEARSKQGNPSTYVVRGKRYYVKQSSAGFVERGIASWYGRKFHGRKTSNGETYNMYAMSAAHKTLPIPTYLQVTNLRNGRSTVVRVNDRGPFHDNRIIDLSYAAASKLGIVETGTGLVEIRAVGPGHREPVPPPTPVTRVASKSQPPASTPAAAAVPVNYSPQPAAAPAAKPAAKEPTLYLQVGAFISRSNAEQLRSKLMLNNVSKAAIHQGASNNQTVYRVRIGPIASVEEADRMASEISGLGVGTPRITID